MAVLRHLFRITRFDDDYFFQDYNHISFGTASCKERAILSFLKTFNNYNFNEYTIPVEARSPANNAILKQLTVYASKGISNREFARINSSYIFHEEPKFADENVVAWLSPLYPILMLRDLGGEADNRDLLYKTLGLLNIKAYEFHEEKLLKDKVDAA